MDAVVDPCSCEGIHATSSSRTVKCLAKSSASGMWGHIQKGMVQVLRPAAGQSQTGLLLLQASIHVEDMPEMTRIRAEQAKMNWKLWETLDPVFCFCVQGGWGVGGWRLRDGNGLPRIT